MARVLSSASYLVVDLSIAIDISLADLSRVGHNKDTSQQSSHRGEHQHAEGLPIDACCVCVVRTISSTSSSVSFSPRLVMT